MKKIAVIIVALSASLGFSQGRGVKFGYIDMNYILENIPDYAEAKMQLDDKARTWKNEIQLKRGEIDKLKENLKTEKALLTKELIEEREEEITLLERELLSYQESRFGVNGSLMAQKNILIKPIQDQIFTAIQDIADKKGFAMVFDRSSDFTILYAARQYDLSDQVLRSITQAQKREQLTKKQLKDQQVKEAEEEAKELTPEQEERKKLQEDTRNARQKQIEEQQEARKKQIAEQAEIRKQQFEQRQKEAQERRQKIIDERNALKNGTKIDSTKTQEQKQ